jgi:hypothetical protein
MARAPQAATMRERQQFNTMRRFVRAVRAGRRHVIARLSWRRYESADNCSSIQ